MTLLSHPCDVLPYMKLSIFIVR